MNSKVISIIIIIVTISLNSTAIPEVLAKEEASKQKQVKSKRRDIFADPENLKVLSEDISSAELRATMKTFSLGLGLRCLDCHVGKEGKLETYDFASDKKKLKRKARVMLKMVQNINDKQMTNLDKIDQLDNIEQISRVYVRCVTCHRGQQKPELIQDVLAESYAEGGIKLVIGKYAELRNKYYGSHTFDFHENTLPLFARDFFKERKTATDAVTLLKANKTYFPESFFGSFSLANAYAQSGDTDKAIKAYENALQINPKANFVKKKIRQLKEKK